MLATARRGSNVCGANTKIKLEIVMGEESIRAIAQAEANDGGSRDKGDTSGKRRGQ